MSSQGTQGPNPTPTGGPKGRPMIEAPTWEPVLVWDGSIWIQASYQPWGVWHVTSLVDMVKFTPQCWIPLAEGHGYVPPPVLP